MTEQNNRHTTGDPDIEAQIQSLLDAASITNNRDQIYEILVTSLLLASDDASRLDLKITNAALKEMRLAFRTFTPFRGRPKITMFGSARTAADNPNYAQARDLAALLAEQGWMVVTGAGPGIMAAGLQGAGRENAMGVNIRLPFESSANEFIADDPKLVEMKYFFTRKLVLVKESDGFVVFPGGVGTLDEAFELLTLLQTGKAEPVPIVFLDEPGGHFWEAMHSFLDGPVKDGAYISPDDTRLYLVTDDIHEAAREIIGFYRNYHSRRWVGSRLVVRTKVAPTDDELDSLTGQFADALVSGRIERTEPLAAEVQSDDSLDQPRIVMRFDRKRQARLRDLINALNQLPSGQALPDAPVHYITPAD
jgi:uncharacterized protein (TIGR00730 family)